MIRSATNLLRRYQAINAVFTAAPHPLHEPDGRLLGCVELTEFRAGRVRITGWCLSDSLRLVTLTGAVAVRRHLHRGDITLAIGEAEMHRSGNSGRLVAFDEETVWHGGPLFLELQRDHEVLNWQLPVPSERQIRLARRRLLLPFARKCAGAIPKAVVYLRRGRPKALRSGLADHFGLYPPQPTSLRRFDGSVFAPSDAQTRPAPAVSIVLPVYNAFDLLPEALARIEANTDLPWHLTVIEDCSSDARVRPWLQDWCRTRADRVTLIENESNLGFIASVNRGLSEVRGRAQPVILLNSDAFVPKGWASRLVAPMLRDPKIASVTPMSNDATIFSVPLIAGSSQIRPGSADRIDALAARFSPETVCTPAPTGVGFCMAMSPEALRLVPKLDTAFGRGYGEEVDWCQRVAQAGMKNTGIGTLFVEHRGGQSFGQEHKRAAIEAAGQIITARYPHYDADVQGFIRRDPLWQPRFVLALGWAASQSDDPLHVYLAHSMGGGAESWLRRRITERASAEQATVVIRIGGAERFSVELHLPGGPVTCIAPGPDELRALFCHIEPLHVVYSCGVGDPDPVALPGLLTDLAAQAGSSLEVLFHDYLPISPSFNLLDGDSTWRGLPDPQNPDPVHSSLRPDGSRIGLEAWREAWGVLIARADMITVFSNSSRSIVTQCWPGAAGRIRLTPGQMPHAIPRIQPALPAPGQKPSLAVLGSIGEEKGARILSKLSFALEGRSDGPGLVIIGEFDRRFTLAPSTVVTGRYDIRDLAILMQRHRVLTWLMPSVCPETFSFTTHEMIATGLPVISFDIGAQGEAVAAADNGHIVPVDIAAIIATWTRINGD